MKVFIGKKFPMIKSILQIIKEAVEDFFSDWQLDEPSIADKLYAQKYGIDTPKKEPENVKINAELFGIATHQSTYGSKIDKTPIYKNPNNLNGFDNNIRGILLDNGDFYLAQYSNVLHDDILDLLAKHGLIPFASKYSYWEKMPEQFVAVQRNYNTNEFAQSTVYDTFPIYYEHIFNVGNQKQPFHFRKVRLDELLDPNWLISYEPEGYKHNILDERNFNK